MMSLAALQLTLTVTVAAPARSILHDREDFSDARRHPRDAHHYRPLHRPSRIRAAFNCWRVGCRGEFLAIVLMQNTIVHISQKYSVEVLRYELSPSVCNERERILGPYLRHCDFHLSSSPILKHMEHCHVVSGWMTRPACINTERTARSTPACDR
jgi:hypothetical protein